MSNRDELLKGLTPEQIEKARACKNQEELIAVASEEGIDLTDAQLKAISGGGCANTRKREGAFQCPNCLSMNTVGYYSSFVFKSEGGYDCKCNDCSCVFQAK